jgi:hypothetical protein
MLNSTGLEKRREPPAQPAHEIAPRILNLPELVAELPEEDQERFNRIFCISEVSGTLAPPEAMHEWIRGYFGSVEAVSTQQIIKVTNLVSWEGALYNELRARRPLEIRGTADLDRVIAETRNDPFCRPLEGTPADTFGRVHGKHSVTASNVAKYDGSHGIVIFEEHHPLALTRERVRDYIDTAIEWGRQAHAADPAASYFFFMWNCVWKAAASLVHGHTQMTLTRDMHYPKVEFLRRQAAAYCAQYDANYFQDLQAVHRALRLGFTWRSVDVAVALTPVKERETLLMASSLNDDLKDAIFTVLDTFVKQLGVSSFNVAIQMPPIGPAAEDWGGFPVLARIVDRGDPMNRTGDIGAMELYAASVIGTDPFYVAEALETAFQEA